MNANFTLTPTFGSDGRLTYKLELFETNPDGSATVTAVITASPADTINNLLNNVIDVDVPAP